MLEELEPRALAPRTQGDCTWGEETKECDESAHKHMDAGVHHESGAHDELEPLPQLYDPSGETVGDWWINSWVRTDGLSFTDSRCDPWGEKSVGMRWISSTHVTCVFIGF